MTDQGDISEDPDFIVIPDSAKEVKAWFRERPNDDVVRRIRDHIRDGNPSYLCWCHTHTKPPKGAQVVYLGEFDVPTKLPMAPCPCCWWRTPKFREDGKIAWFPDEAVIRLIGPDCFRTLNPEGHARAVRELEAEQQRKRDIAYLLQMPDAAPKARKAIQSNLRIAKAIDELHSAVSRALRTNRIRLWEYVKSGMLRVHSQETVVTLDQHGNEVRKTLTALKDYAPIRGYKFFSPNLKSFAARLQEADDLLAEVDLGADPRKAVDAASDEQRRTWASALAKGIMKATLVTQELEEVKRALLPESFNTLRTTAYPLNSGAISCDMSTKQEWCHETREPQRLVA